VIAEARPGPRFAPEEEAFNAALVRHRPELQRHCLRLVRCRADAEDALQETLLRAWRSRRTLASDAPRAWLYRIATNACFDLLARRDGTVASLDDATVFGDDGPRAVPAPSEECPDAVVVAQETLELALLAAIGHLPARQHTSFVMRDLLCWSAAESATALATSVAATNSALQRARDGLRAHLGGDRHDWTCDGASRSQRGAARRYLSALEAVAEDAGGVPTCA
jgi:RNA polymerase sigma factor (sigma-70 family)